jgi:predicted nucleic acid-binding protein
VQESSFVHDEIELLFVKQVVFMHMGIVFLAFQVHYECHVTEAQRDVLAKEDPAVSLLVETMAFVEAECVALFVLKSLDLVLVDEFDIVTLESKPLF